MESLELVNFRAFQTAALRLPAHGLVLLAGANNSGKTALLSALDLVVRGAVPTTPRHAAAVEPARVRARFVLSEQEQNQLLEASGLTGKARTEALRWIEWHFIEAPENALQALELHASWPDRDTLLIAQVVFIPPSSHRLLRNRGVLETLSGSAPSGGSGPDPLRDSRRCRREADSPT